MPREGAFHHLIIVSYPMQDKNRKEIAVLFNTTSCCLLSDVTMTLATCNLSFRGHRETRDSTQMGNVMNIIDLLAKYDPLPNDHLSEKRIQKYLNPKVQNELIAIIGSRIKENIVKNWINDGETRSRYLAVRSPRLLKANGRRRLSHLVKQNRRQTVAELTAQYNTGPSTSFLEHKVQRTLLTMGLHSRRPSCWPLLTKRHCKLRLDGFRNFET
ncbi:transposable element Tc1 transposase [Trichonephila clavipes]|nr:transposable element Tc1 transposase [Trichonephila clavipes]